MFLADSQSPENALGKNLVFPARDGVTVSPPNQRYNEDMVPVQAECATFVCLAQEEFPELAAALEARGALDILPVIVVKWFLSAFVDTLPEETVRDES